MHVLYFYISSLGPVGLGLQAVIQVATRQLFQRPTETLAAGSSVHGSVRLLRAKGNDNSVQRGVGYN